MTDTQRFSKHEGFKINLEILPQQDLLMEIRSKIYKSRIS